MTIRRINLYAGPGSGKSVTAAWLWGQLKVAGYNIELIPEWPKKWCYEQRSITAFDEVYAFAKQMHKEDSYLKQGIDFIISDCPLLMVAAYSLAKQTVFTEELIKLSCKFEDMYPSINIFIDRGDILYQQNGRYENYQQALDMDKLIYDLMSDYLPNRFVTFKTKQREEMFQYLVSII